MTAHSFASAGSLNGARTRVQRLCPSGSRDVLGFDQIYCTNIGTLQAARCAIYLFASNVSGYEHARAWQISDGKQSIWLRLREAWRG